MGYNDIFIDTNLAHNLINPMNDHFKKLYLWLYHEGALAITKKLIAEYGQGNQNLAVVVNYLTVKGRVNCISKQQLTNLSIPKKIEKRLLSNRSDHTHIKTVILSDRKIAISADKNLIDDINNYPKYQKIKACCADCPSKINYQ